MDQDNKLIDILLHKTDALDSRLDSIDKTLVAQHEQLKEHMRRSQLNEENLNLLREEVKPVQKHVFIVEGLMKVIGAASAIFFVVQQALKALF